MTHDQQQIFDRLYISLFVATVSSAKYSAMSYGDVATKYGVDIGKQCHDAALVGAQQWANGLVADGVAAQKAADAAANAPVPLKVSRSTTPKK